MSTGLTLIIAIIAALFLSLPASAQEVAYAYSESGGRPLESGNITPYNGTDLVISSIASERYAGGSALQGSGIPLEEIRKKIEKKLNVGNLAVRDAGRSLILEYPGDGTINQICSIYEHMVFNWSYARDTRGIEEFQYSNQSLEYGKGRYSGQGDCDDFSILMASLIESIGGTSRIILAYGPDGAHAYTEVYLGKAGGPEGDVQRMISWLSRNYKVDEINTHKDFQTGDVWLNLDWWKEPGGAKHPGGPFFKATSQTPIPTRVNISLAPLTPLNDPPVAQFTISPSPPIVGENTSFNASSSKDIGGILDSYSWDFGDGNKSGRMSEPTADHVYLKGGPCTVILTVEDDEGAVNIRSQKIVVNNPPWANFTITPEKPVVGDQVKFDASSSYDEEDGEDLEFHWEITNNSAIFSVASLPKQIYEEEGLYWINLTVTDKDGATGHKNVLLKINQRPIPRISFDGANLSAGKMITFDARSSEDLDGEIVSYAWDFGGFGNSISTLDYNKTALHTYNEGGKKTVKLSVIDNDGAINNTSQEIYINRLPVAKFFIDPIRPKKGEPVSFDASESSDPDGWIQRYLWDFGMGKVESEAYYLSSAEYTYNKPGVYNITLTVEDDKGATGSFSQSVEIEEIETRYNPSDSDEYSRVSNENQMPEKTGTQYASPDDGSINTAPSGGSAVYTTSLGLSGYSDGYISNEDSAKTAPSGESAVKEANGITLELTKLHHEGRVWAVAFSPDGSKVLTGSDDNTAHIWDASSSQELLKLHHNSSVAAVAFSPDGSQVLTGSGDGTVCIWNASSGQKLHTLPHDVSVAAVAFSPDGSKVLTGSYDDTACIWDASSGKELHTLHFDGVVLAVAFSHDGSKAMIGSNDGIAKIWNTSSHQALFTLLHKDRVVSVAFSPDDSKALTGSYDSTACIWDVSSGQKLHTLRHEGVLNSVAFSPDGSKALTGSNDGTARIWDASSGKELHKLPHKVEVLAVAFSPDGSKVLTGGSDGIARIWGM